MPILKLFVNSYFYNNCIIFSTKIIIIIIIYILFSTKIIIIIIYIAFFFTKLLLLFIFSFQPKLILLYILLFLHQISIIIYIASFNQIIVYSLFSSTKLNLINCLIPLISSGINNFEITALVAISYITLLSLYITFIDQIK